MASFLLKTENFDGGNYNSNLTIEQRWGSFGAFLQKLEEFDNAEGEIKEDIEAYENAVSAAEDLEKVVDQQEADVNSLEGGEAPAGDDQVTGENGEIVDVDSTEPRVDGDSQPAEVVDVIQEDEAKVERILTKLTGSSSVFDGMGKAEIARQFYGVQVYPVKVESAMQNPLSIYKQKLEENQGILSKMWEKIKAFFKKIWDAILRLFRGKAAEAKIEQIEEKAKAIDSNLESFKGELNFSKLDKDTGMINTAALYNFTFINNFEHGKPDDAIKELSKTMLKITKEVATNIESKINKVISKGVGDSQFLLDLKAVIKYFKKTKKVSTDEGNTTKNIRKKIVNLFTDGTGLCGVLKDMDDAYRKNSDLYDKTLSKNLDKTIDRMINFSKKVKSSDCYLVGVGPSCGYFYTDKNLDKIRVEFTTQMVEFDLTSNSFKNKDFKDDIKKYAKSLSSGSLKKNYNEAVNLLDDAKKLMDDKLNQFSNISSKSGIAGQEALEKSDDDIKISEIIKYFVEGVRYVFNLIADIFRLNLDSMLHMGDIISGFNNAIANLRKKLDL